MKSLALLPLLLLAACATTKEHAIPPVEVVEVAVPVPQACVPKTLGEAPAYVDSNDVLLNAADMAERYRLIYAGRLQRIGRLGELEPVVKSCPREK